MMKGFARWIVIVLMVAGVALIAVGVTLGVTIGSSEPTPTPTPTPEAEAEELVPSDANFVASIQINTILTDEDLITAYNEASKEPDIPETVDEALEEIEDEFGIDPRDFSEGVVFGDTESDDYFGAIVTGTFDPEALIESIEEATGEETAISTYKGYQIYTMTVEDEAVAICFLSDDTVAVGQADAVKDIIDVKEGDKSCISGRGYDTYSALGDVWIKGAVELPEETMSEILDEILEEGEIPGLEAFEDIEVAGFGLDKEGENIFLQIKLYFSNAESAEDAEDVISSIITLLPLISPDIPPEVADLLEELSISLSDSWLTITLEITVEEIEELIEALEEA